MRCGLFVDFIASLHDRVLLTPPQQPKKRRTAKQSGDRANGQLTRRKYGSCQGVGQNQERRAHQQRTKTMRKSSPNNNLTACGTIRPTKPIAPPAATVTPTISEQST